jgi:catalase
VATPEQAVDALNGVFGRHPGFRAAHAKGTVCSGTFTASRAASALTTAAHMQGEPVEVIARLSNASGHPGAPDLLNARGLAVKFALPAGGSTDIVSVTLNRFLVRTPDEFVELNRALRHSGDGDRPGFRPLRLGWFLLRHPDHLKALADAVKVEPVASYAQCRYNALHSFKWIDDSESGRWLRYSWLPEEAPRRGTGDPKRQDRDCLQRELAERLEREPVRFALELQLAQEGDPITDPMSAWPQQREKVQAGTLELTAVVPEQTLLVFDPTRVTDGIELSDDPILHFRPRAYDVSVKRRSS